MSRTRRTSRMSRVLPLMTLMTLIALCTGAAPAALSAQTPGDPQPRPVRQSLSGPRLGLTVLSGESARIAKEDHGLKRAVVSQFGWQFERRFLSPERGPHGVFEWVLLVGGMDQGAFFPSISWITGIRTESGIEFGAGPNATPLGVGLAIAAGMTARSGHMNFPLNVALVSSENGVRTSVLAGFTMRR